LTLSASGVEIMVHIGLDTVNLKGEGFTPHVRIGDEVRTGQKLISFDADYVATHARSLLTQMVITNADRVAAMKTCSGRVRAAHDVVVEIMLAAGAAPESAGHMAEAVESEPLVIANGAGLHARPAALVAATARKFTSDIRLVKGDRDANARSIVAIMALEVGPHDAVRIVARGDDAHAAIQAIKDTIEHEAAEALHAAAQRAQVARLRPIAAAPDGALLGVPAAPGVAVGRVFRLRHEDAVIAERAGDAGHERHELDAAIASARVQLEELQKRLHASADAERAAIFAAQQGLLEDPELVDAALDLIGEGASAAHAWRQAYSAQAERLVKLNNPLLAGRAADLRDVGKRVLHLLVGHSDTKVDVPAESIIIAEDVSPSETASFDRTKVLGICTTMGSATSHVAILARALGIPAVAGIDPLALELPAGTRVIVDGDAGLLNPRPDTVQEAEVARKQAAASEQRSADLEVAAQPATTRDGQRVKIVANVGSEKEATQVVAGGGEGVGLLRTEFLFMDRASAPDEDEQARIYQQMLRALSADHTLIIRALDVGGDKPLSYLPVALETNPFLGERGIRLLLNRPAVLRAQVRAVVQASRSGKVALMLPMISTLAEWHAAREIIEAEREGAGAAAFPVGIMVETASAALLADRFAETADFLSIGTNDLTQYTLAMDRTNARMARQLDGLHPAVLRLMELTVAGAHKHQRWVGVCGGLASDPEAVPVLIGLGVDELSVTIPAIAGIKARIRGLSMDECRATARAALAAGDAEEVRALIRRRHGDAQ
jgi:phosphocarrier protein FPr